MISDRVLVAAVGVLLFGGVVVGVGAFLADPGAATPGPVAFDDTLQRGLPVSVEQRASESGASVPRVEVFYSQVQYAVGYTGIGEGVAAIQRAGRERQFGHPLVVYVSDYEGTGASCEGGTLRADGTVIRNNSFRGGRFGVHLMYSSETLIEGNYARGREGF